MQDIQTIPSTIQQLAHALLLHEADQKPEPEELWMAIEHIYAKLQRRLAELVGQTGFVALFSRALHLARRETPVLAGISIDPRLPNQLQGSQEFALAHPDDVITSFGRVVAHFIWLLVTFVGEQLSMNLISDIWPQLNYDATAHGGIQS